MTLLKVLQLCIKKKLMFQLLVTQLTQLDSNIQLQVLIRKNVLSKVRSISQLHQVVVLVEHFTQTTWQQVQLHMV